MRAFRPFLMCITMNNPLQSSLFAQEIIFSVLLKLLFNFFKSDFLMQKMKLCPAQLLPNPYCTTQLQKQCFPSAPLFLNRVFFSDLSVGKILHSTLHSLASIALAFAVAAGKHIRIGDMCLHFYLAATVSRSTQAKEFLQPQWPQELLYTMYKFVELTNLRRCPAYRGAGWCAPV